MPSQTRGQSRRGRGDRGSRQQQEPTGCGGRGGERRGTTPTTRRVPSRSSYGPVTRRSSRLSQTRGSSSVVPVASSANSVSRSTAVLATAP
ncbi:unnamed protein product, partial [Heligmosomoides polygyrus]|uniref:NP1 n=1 Tax=Heligmosomoides polygyrus TaxID=6339 RepID=A0A183FBU3_HELPZ